MATAACGGDLLGAPQEAGSDVPVAPAIDASSPPEAGVAEASLLDASAPQDGGPVCGEPWWQVFESFNLYDDSGMSSGFVDGVWEFDRQQDFLSFARTIAVNFNFVDPTTGVTCISLATCPYDPRLPRVSPQDVHHSNALDEFVGPDDRPYVWAFYPPLNRWFLVDRLRNPEAYQSIVEFNAGCFPNCACDAG